MKCASVANKGVTAQKTRFFALAERSVQEKNGE
jgi:hypothetical protein